MSAAAASASVAKSRERRVTAGRRIDDEYIHGEDIDEVSIGNITAGSPLSFEIARGLQEENKIIFTPHC